MYTKTNTAGYSMVEVLVAIAILLLATVGPMTIAARSMQHAQFAREQNAAFFLGQEAIEAIIAIRNTQALEHFDQFPGGVDSWDWTTDSALNDCYASDGCGIDWRDNTLPDNIVDCGTADACRLYLDTTHTRARYAHDAGGSAVATPYTREVFLEDVTADIVSVEVLVTWQATGAATSRDVRLKTYIHDIYDLN